jgi:hypothetical protein
MPETSQKRVYPKKVYVKTRTQAVRLAKLPQPEKDRKSSLQIDNKVPQGNCQDT